MRPVYLSIEGINSFSSRQEIDFETLSLSGLFCISGPTGSGKSTILDSIIIALFGDGERGNIADYINLNEDSASVCFDFELGGKIYSVSRKIYKNKPSKGMLKNKTDGVIIAEKITEIDAALKEMIGLSRADFTQVVILEQGKFGKFLNATQNPRINTVASIFKLEKYKNLTKTFNDQKKILDQRLADLSDRILELGGVTGEQVKQHIQREKELSKQREASEREYAAAAAEFSALDALRIVREKSLAAAKRAEELKVSLSGSESRQKSAAEERLRLESRSDEIKENKRLLDGKKILASALEDLAPLQLDKERKEKQRGELLEKYKKAGEEAGLKGEEIKMLAQQKSAEAAAFGSLIAGIRSIIKIDEQLAEAAGNFACSEAAAAGGDSVSLGAMQDTISAAPGSQQDLDQLGDLLVSLRSEANNLTQQISLQRIKTDASEKRLVEANAGLLGISEMWERFKREKAVLEAESKAAEAMLAKMQAGLDAAKLGNAAAHIRSGLREGDVCPVCGGHIKDKSGAAFHDLSDAEKEKAGHENLCKQLRDRLLALEKLIAQTTEKYESGVKNIGIMEAELAESARALTEMCSGISSPGDFPGLPRLAGEAVETLSRIKLLDKKLTASGHAFETLRIEKQSIETDGKRLREEIEALRGSIIAKAGSEDVAGRRETLKKEIAELGLGIDMYEAEAKKLDGVLRELELEITRQTAELKAALDSAGAAGEFDERRYETVKLKKQELELAKDSFIERLAALREEIKTAEAALARKREIEAVKKDISGKADKVSVVLSLLRRHSLLEFVAEEYISRFTYTASETLSNISGGKFTLEYGEDGAFYVRDFLMNGEKRKISTLSGGETFLASLSVAIAISGEISKYHDFGFFFLDEGFGTLDSRSLETVTNALEMLSKETLVGVVTHRSELVDYIPCRISVIPSDENSGSKIKTEY